MDFLTTEQLRSIVQSGKSPAISLFLPTHPTGRDTRQDPIELKNLLREAEEKLTAKGMRPTEARDLLEPVRLLVDDQDFWKAGGHGLAIYLAPDFMEAYHVPIELEHTCVVNDRFDIRPLLPLLADKRFYIVAVSDNRVRLLECMPTACHQVALPEDVSLALEDAVRGGHENPGAFRHGGAPNVGGSFQGMSSDIQDEIREDHLFFYRQIDDGVRRVMRNEHDAVIVAAADSVAPFYKQASQLKNLQEEWIRGNPEHVSDEQLHKQGCEMMQCCWHKELLELQDQFGTAISHNLASQDLKEIIPAASMGRVGILFVSTGTTHWGKISDSNEIVDVDSAQPDAEDLIDRAAFETILTQGQVVVVKPEEMPGQGELAAIYRY